MREKSPVKSINTSVLCEETVIPDIADIEQALARNTVVGVLS